MKLILDTILIEGFINVFGWLIFMYFMLIIVHGILSSFRKSL